MRTIYLQLSLIAGVGSKPLGKLSSDNRVPQKGTTVNAQYMPESEENFKASVAAAASGAKKDLTAKQGEVVNNDTDKEYDIEHESKLYRAYNRMQDSPEEDGEKMYSFDDYAEDGKGKYSSNFPKGTPKSAKAEKILSYIQNVWSKSPIPLVIKSGESERTISAKFDPNYDESGNTNTDASKLMGGNRHGTSLEQRVTLDLADDYYQIASDSKYNYSKAETGKDNPTHKDVTQWHYFVNDIYFAEYGSEEYQPYRVSINVKEKADGDFVYSFSAEKQRESSTHRTLHADVNGENNSTANAKLSTDIINQKDLSVNTQCICKKAKKIPKIPQLRQLPAQKKTSPQSRVRL